MKNKEWLVLCIITVVAALALACTNLLTKGRIEEQAVQAANASRQAVMNAANGFQQETLAEGATLDNLYRAMDGDTQIGYVGQATATGFGGPIEVVVGVNEDSEITGISVGGTDFAETAGLGTKTREPAFTDQFVGLKRAPVLKENIDAVSGATISSTAVTKAARQVYEYAVAMLNGGEAPVAVEAIPLTSADQRSVIVKGYGHEIEVRVAVQPDGSIEAISVGGENFSETPGLGEMAKEPEFTNQFAGKTGPLSYGKDGLEAISGATVTSNAVLDAVNQALGFETEKRELPAPEVTVLDAPDERGAVKIVKVTTMGYNGEIVVTVGVDAEGKVATLKIGGPNFKETEYLGAEVQTNIYRDQFIGKAGPFTYGNGVDAVTGATITSDAVLAAINEALAQ